MSQIKRCHYRDFFPTVHHKGQAFRIEYRKASRTYDLYQNGQLYGKYRHSDLALLAVLRVISGFNGDDVPDKLKRTLNALAKKFEITYQGLADD